MKKTNFLWMIAAFFVFTGCNKYDDEIDQLNQDIASVDSEVQQLAQQLLALQNWQTQVNADIQSLKTIVAALEKKDYVTSVEPTADGTGYVITFQNSGTVTIRHGKDGETPDISVKQAEDGLYYWTMDGDWLTDAAGKKIPTTGEDGKDGADAIAPQVRISSTTNLWEISTDGGSTWTSTGVQATGPKGDKGNTGATGAQGPQGEKGEKGDKGDTGASGSDGDDGSHGDSFFSSVVVNDDKVVFTLADGTTTFTLPLYQTFVSQIQNLTYIPTHTDGKATMAYNTTSRKWEAELSFFVTPKSVVGNIKREHISAKGVYTAATRAVNLINLSVTAFESDATNGTITVTVSDDNLTNFLNGTSDAAVFLIISDGNSEFVSDYVPLAPANMSADDLKAAVSQALNDGVRDFTITGNLTEEQQKAIGTALNDWCHNYDGKLNNPDGQGTVTLTLPDVTAIADRAFRPNEEYGGDALKSITLPNVTVIGESAFDGQNQLQSLIAPKVTEVKMKGLFTCRALTNVQMPDITTVGQSAFAATGITTFPWDNLQSIDRASFSLCTSISGVISLPKVASIDIDAFQGCSNLTGVIAPEVKTIGSSAFSYCPNLTELTFSTAIESVGGQVLHNGNQSLYSENITLTLAADQKVLSGGDNTNYWSNWTIAEGASGVEFGTDKTFCGYTFKEIKEYGE